MPRFYQSSPSSSISRSDHCLVLIVIPTQYYLQPRHIQHQAHKGGRLFQIQARRWDRQQHRGPQQEERVQRHQRLLHLCQTHLDYLPVPWLQREHRGRVRRHLHLRLAVMAALEHLGQSNCSDTLLLENVKANDQLPIYSMQCHRLYDLNSQTPSGVS